MVKFSKLIKKLKKKKLKISFAESCTGGLLAQSITSISGASKVFNLSVVTYSNKSKSSILNVPKKIINKFGAVSEECCLSMVKNLAKISKSQINVSITGIAGPVALSLNRWVLFSLELNIKVKTIFINICLQKKQGDLFKMQVQKP